MMWAVGLCLTGCSTDVEQAQLADPATYTAPTLDPVADIMVNADNDKETVVFTCSPVSFGQPVEINYRVMLTRSGHDTIQHDTIQLATSQTPNISVMKTDINGAAINRLGVEANESAELCAYVVAYVGNTTLCTPKSNCVDFTIQTYKAPLRSYYLCGYFVLGTTEDNWKVDKAVSIWETDGGTNIYEGMYMLTSDEVNTPGKAGFKVLVQRAWDGGEMGYDAFKTHGSAFSASGDGNLELNRGIWQLSVNIGTMAIDAKKINKVEIVGDWGNWEENPVEMNYNPETNTWTSAIPVESAEFKVLLIDDAGKTWLGDGTKNAENMEGIKQKSAYEIKDGGNITTMPAGAHYVVLYADRTPYVIAYEPAK